MASRRANGDDRSGRGVFGRLSGLLEPAAWRNRRVLPFLFALVFVVLSLLLFPPTRQTEKIRFREGDIADVDVGENVGAQLQAAQAEADMRRAKAEAEKRRAMAVAREQEMRALVVENESKVPLAMAEAFKKGNLGVMDYYRMKNVMADTSMRDSIAKPRKKE